MKIITYCICFLFLLQFYSCASQTDSIRIENDKKTTTKGTTNPTKKDKIGSQKPKKSNASAPVDDEYSEEGDFKEVEEEEEIKGLSIISYENILEANKSERPVQGQKVKLMIKNNHSQAMWYLMPVSGEKKMPSDGKFIVNPDADPPFLAKRYGAETEQLIELIYHGTINQSFRAFYVEAGSSLLFRNYDLGTYSEGDYVPFWATKGLVVNNNLSLEDWLPFSVLSSPNVVLHNTTEQGTAKWKNLSASAAFPATAIEFIQANSIKKYQIPVGVIR